MTIVDQTTADRAGGDEITDDAQDADPVEHRESAAIKSEALDVTPDGQQPAGGGAPDGQQSAPLVPGDPDAAASDAEPAGPATPARRRKQATPEDPLRDVTDRLGALDARLIELTSRLDGTSEQAQSAGSLVESAQARLIAIEASGGATVDRVNSAETRLDSTEHTLSATVERLGSVVSRLDSGDGVAQAATGRLASLTDRLVAVDGRLDAMDDHLATLQHHAAGHDRALAEVGRTIAAEVERHTTDALVQTQHNLHLAVNSIAQLALAMSESSRDITEDVSAESATTLLESFRVDLDAILAQLGYEPLGTAPGQTFDPHRHRALKRVSTSDPLQDKVITRVIRDGYVSVGTGRILLFADVEVSRLRT